MAEKVNQKHEHFGKKVENKKFNRIEQLTETARYQLLGA
jgi:hypothetical protein